MPFLERARKNAVYSLLIQFTELSVFPIFILLGSKTERRVMQGSWNFERISQLHSKQLCDSPHFLSISLSHRFSILRFPFIGISPLNDVENHRKAEKSKLTLLM
jgi:hypothetical protein